MTHKVKPKRLAPDARIGIVNPAYWLEPERRQHAVSVFEHLGYELVLGKSTDLVQDKYAGSPEDRAADIMAMFEDPSIDAIICARGGYGGNRVTPLLDYELIRQNPKIFIGYSDITASLTSIAQQSGLVTFHGPMLSTFADKALPFNLDSLQDMLSGRGDIRIDSPADCRARILRPGIASGQLWGGNLTIVINRLGTPDQIDTTGVILLIEDVDEELYAFDRMMMHLKMSGSLKNIKALLVGEMAEMSDSNTSFGKSTDDIVLDVCSDLDIPIISNFPCGHGDYQATLPIGHEVELHAKDDPFILIPESPVL